MTISDERAEKKKDGEALCEIKSSETKWGMEGKRRREKELYRKIKGRKGGETRG